MLHEKEMATLHLEADKAMTEGLDHLTRSPNFQTSAKQKRVSMLI